MLDCEREPSSSTYRRSNVAISLKILSYDVGDTI